MAEPGDGLLIALVGPCAAGKTTMVSALRERGWSVRQPAQEHSGVPDMWRRMSRPDVLIYLDASLATIRRHRPWIDWGERYLAELERRLRHAREHADLVLCVDGQDVEESLARIDEFLARL
ncbi:MAG: hypothetical protein ACK2UL_10640 [Anaerolineae bacterium]